MENEAAEQLAAIAEARSSVADRLVTPWWYHPILGLLFAGYLVGLSLGSNPVRFVTVVLFFAGCAALAYVYRRMTGVWVSGFEAGRAGRWATGIAVLVGATILTAWSVAEYTALRWPVWTLAVVVFVGSVVLGRRFDSALRAQLRAGA